MELSFSYANQGTFIALPLGAGVQSVTVDGAPAAYTVSSGGVTLASAPALRSVVSVNFEPVSADVVQSGVWRRAPTLPRLRLVGSGSAVVRSRSALGVERVVDTFVALNAINQIEYPVLDQDAAQVRVDFPATLTVEVL